ncbi:DEAD/DEAH box helicase [Mycoplasmatota bacterium zrk1]
MMNDMLHKKLLNLKPTSKFDFLIDVLGEDVLETLDLDISFSNIETLNKLIGKVDFAVLYDEDIMQKVLYLFTEEELKSIFGVVSIPDLLNRMKPYKGIEATNRVFSSTLESSNKRFFELLDYQYIMKNRVLHYFNNSVEASTAIIHMPTGSGKTKTTMHILIDFILSSNNSNVTLLWLAQSKELVEQAFYSFEQAWETLGVGNIISTVLVGDNKLDSNTSGVIFSTYQKLDSLYSKGDRDYLILQERTSMIVCDEAHHAAAKSWRKPIVDIVNNNSHLIGLTATPGRGGKDVNVSELKSMFSIIFTIDMKTAYKTYMTDIEFRNTFSESHDFDPVVELQNRGILSYVYREEIVVDKYSKEDKKQLLSAINENTTLKILSKNRYRNKMILDKLLEINERGLQTIVFACNNNHAYLLQKLLLLNDIQAGVVTDRTPKDLRDKTILEFKKGNLKFIINNKILTTGFDSPNIDCVFITKATSSAITYSQMIGRGLRGPKVGGNHSCILVDVIDNFKSYSNENKIFNYFKKYWR